LRERFSDNIDWNRKEQNQENKIENETDVSKSLQNCKLELIASFFTSFISLPLVQTGSKDIMNFQGMKMFQRDADNEAQLGVHVHDDFGRDQLQEESAGTTNPDIVIANDSNSTANLGSARASAQTSAPSSHDHADKSDNAPNELQTIDTQLDESETAVQERHIAEQRHQIIQDATTKLHSALQRVKNVTKTMLSEMEVYLESAESVEVDYIRCQHSQKKEARRLMEVEPDITGTTGALKFQMNWE
jgi:hypothetical protein